MKEMNDVKKVIAEVLKYKNIVFQDENWNADYKMDWAEGVDRLMKSALEDVRKLSVALEANDEVAAIAAIVMARGRFLMLSGFFYGIHEDFEKLCAKDVEWPSVPENYVYK